MTRKYKTLASSKIMEVVREPKTREQKINDMWDHLSHQIEFDLKHSQEKLDQWTVRFQDDAVNALEWSADIFKIAGGNRAAKEIKSWISEGLKKGDDYIVPDRLEIMKEVRRLLYGEVLRRSRWPEHSTSQPHNVMSIELNSARAEWLEKFDRKLEYIEKGE